jgi:hypothetical protein
VNSDSEPTDKYKKMMGVIDEETFNARFKKEKIVVSNSVDSVEDIWSGDSNYTELLKPFKQVSHKFNSPTGLDEESVERFENEEIDTFYFSAPDPMVLNYSKKLRDSPVLPSTFLLQDLFVWFPALMFGEEGYPHCRYCSNNKPEVVRFKDWTTPRSVICLNRVIKTVTIKYHCLNCDKYFNN